MLPSGYRLDDRPSGPPPASAVEQTAPVAPPPPGSSAAQPAGARMIPQYDGSGDAADTILGESDDEG
eukprot:246302-Prymnesium_polylepis.1